MGTPNIPSQSKRFLIESPHSGLPREYYKELDMVNPIRTTISVGDLNLFRIFLDANDMSPFELGYYEFRDPESPFMAWTIENKICYTNNQPNDLIENNLMYMTLKYGGLVKAFEHYKIAIGRLR